MKIIGTENKVNYGVFDGPVEFNHKEFQLLDFLVKKLADLENVSHLKNSIISELSQTNS